MNNIRSSDFYKATKENESENSKEFHKIIDEYLKYCEDNGIEPIIITQEKIDENYFILHDYIDWFNHRKDECTE